MSHAWDMYVFCATQFHYLYDSTAAGTARERESFNYISDVTSAVLHVLV